MSPGQSTAHDRRPTSRPDRPVAAVLRPGDVGTARPLPGRGEIVERCRDLMAAAGLTPASPRPDLMRVAHDVVAAAGHRPDPDVVADISDALRGWGPLHQLLDQPDIEEIWWNDPSRIFVARGGSAELSHVALTEPEARAIVQRAVTASGRRLDTAHPFVDVQLPEGGRLHVAVPPITPRHWAVNIRRHILRPTSVADLVRLGMLSDSAARFLASAMSRGANVVVSGGTHTGKTTVLNALLGSVAGQRVVSCEEVRELALPHADWVSLQTRDAGLEGTGAVSLRDLVRESLRMRPGRLVVGEVRGPEALDLLLAMNSGVPAGATVHANSAEDAVDKLVGLPLLAGPNISGDFAARTLGNCLDVVVHLGRTHAGRRIVGQICSVAAGIERPRVGSLFRWQGDAMVRAGGELPDWTATAR